MDLARRSRRVITKVSPSRRKSRRLQLRPCGIGPTGFLFEPLFAGRETFTLHRQVLIQGDRILNFQQ